MAGLYVLAIQSNLVNRTTSGRDSFGPKNQLVRTDEHALCVAIYYNLCNINSLLNLDCAIYKYSECTNGNYCCLLLLKFPV